MLTLILTLMLGTTPKPSSQDVVRLAPPEVVLTGCVVQGSSDKVMIFDNAKKDPKNAAEKGGRYVLASATPEFDLRKHLNHAVRITGEVDMRVSAMPEREPSDPKRPVDERTLPRLIVKSVTTVSDKCPPVR